ncbi:uncharacterized protein DNG_05583 [Cephalotrichum gorgonifer]|uniref:Uncharacterized protein n=1 Tax=Cephalotrichum gorgonifer TaxID=2041049 RepID=A0AAE8N130_9PEZI|nr:uncharacterized protein DNG_05583 [Cephalotrichum gorgonifer]
MGAKPHLWTGLPCTGSESVTPDELRKPE